MVVLQSNPAALWMSLPSLLHQLRGHIYSRLGTTSNTVALLDYCHIATTRRPEQLHQLDEGVLGPGSKAAPKLRQDRQPPEGHAALVLRLQQRPAPG